MAKDKTPRELVQELHQAHKDCITTHNQIVRAIVHNQRKQDYAPLVEQRDQFLEQEQSIRNTLKKGH